MLVIEGKNGKSKFVQDMLNCTMSSLVLDSVGVKGLIVEKGNEHYLLPKDVSLLEIEELLEDYDMSNVDRVVLLLNSDKSSLYDIKNIALKFLEHNFVVTVQSDEENIKVYDY